ncbi:MAG: TSUP family transporter [Pseudomonadota bacterium]
MDFAALGPGSLALIFLALGIGGFAKGVTGIGLPLVAIPILANFIGVERTVVVMVLPSLVSNGWLVWATRHAAPPLSRLIVFLVCGVLGSLAGTWLLAAASEKTLTIALALWLAAYLILLLANPRFLLPAPRLLAPCLGLAAGAIQGATGVSAPIIAPYLTGIGLARQAFVHAITLAFTVFSAGQIIAMAKLGLMTGARLVEGLWALLPVALALPLGMRVGERISHRAFERILILVFLALEARLIYRGFWT